MSKKNRPSAAQRRMNRIREAFDPAALKRICETPQRGFGAYADIHADLPPAVSWRGTAYDDNFYYHRDNGAPVLFVAHLDHVQADPTCSIVQTGDGPLALSGALDDRLGAYVGLELLPKLGVKVDVLLTTNEEMGASSARDFDTNKVYNWMIEFDRGGTDVVMYQYDNADTRSLVEATGTRVGLGSYSDIADLEHLGCAGFNWGVGYEDYHSARSHAWLNDTFKMVSRFMRFYRANAATHLPFEETPSRLGNGKWWDEEYDRLNRLSEADRGDDVADDGFDVCPMLGCGAELDSWRCCNTCGYGVLDKEDLG